MRLLRSIRGMRPTRLKSNTPSEAAKADEPCVPWFHPCPARCDARRWTIGADVVGIAARHLAEHGPADFHRVLVVLGLDAPSAVVPGAPLDSVQRRTRHKLQRFAGFLTHVLDPRVAGDMVGHLAEAGL